MLMRLARSIRRLVVVSTVLGAAGLAIQAQQHWVGSWSASQQLVEPGNSISAEDLTDATLRQIVHLTIGGGELRLRLSNRYGSAPLHIASVHIARPVSPDSSKISPGSDQALAFSGHRNVTIPAGADYLSDPVKYSMSPLSDLAITIHLETVPADQTGHPGSRATSYLVHGDLVQAVELQGAKQIEHWYFIAGIDVWRLPSRYRRSHWGIQSPTGTVPQPTGTIAGQTFLPGDCRRSRRVERSRY